jgi:uncharacterized protein YbjQ (UPF0145 family)
MRFAFVAISLAAAACGGAPQPTSAFVTQSHADYAGYTGVAGETGAPRMLVTSEQTCPRGHDCDIVEVVDIHTRATSQDKGFDELRARAAGEGGDAIIGAEFEHGDGNEPSHLSGVIVRFGNPVPPHTDIGLIDIPSDEKDENKGLSELNRRAHEMGGDQVIDVTFEHGDDGAQGHLRGKVIRFTN